MPSLTIVLGGAASGKSSFAESLCFQPDRPRVYIATAQAFDDEMREKISAHREMRGSQWLTVEAPLDVTTALSERQPSEIVLLDCATLWLSNMLLAGKDLETVTGELVDALGTCPAPVVVVSNEVGSGIVPENAMARKFRNAQGRLNQRLAQKGDLVVQVIAGLPQVLKGMLP